MAEQNNQNPWTSWLRDRVTGQPDNTGQTGQGPDTQQTGGTNINPSTQQPEGQSNPQNLTGGGQTPTGNEGQPAQGQATIGMDAVQALIDNMSNQQAARDQQMFGLIQQIVQPQQQGQQEQMIPMPSAADYQQALDNGDTQAFMNLRAQEQAHNDQRMRMMQQRNEDQLNQARQEAAAAMQGLSAQMLPGQVPDYDRYQPQIEAKMDALGLQGAQRTNPQIVREIRNAVIGENFESEMARVQEERARQANAAPTGDQGGVPMGRTQASSTGANSQPNTHFGQEVYDSLNIVGQDRERVARGMGYSSWAAYEAMAARMHAPDTVVQVHSWLPMGAGQPDGLAAPGAPAGQQGGNQ